METRTAVMVGMLCLGAAGIVGGLLSVLKPAGIRESEAVTSPGAASFAQKSGGSADMSAERLEAQDTVGVASRGPAQPSGSLNFIRNSEGVNTGSEAGGDKPSDEAAAAAAKGDAKGLIQGLQKDEEGKGLGRKATRALMQKVVDIVHQSQPRWYNEFLSNKELKGIADAYDKGLDFGGFLGQLANSKPFRSMLKKRSNTAQLRGLTKRLMSDKQVGPQLEELFFAHAKDPDVIDAVREFGPGAGLPSELLDFAGASARKAAAKPKLNPNAGFGGSRPKLQPRGFGSGKSGFSKDDNPIGAPNEGEAPGGVDPAMLQQYQKYLKK